MNIRPSTSSASGAESQRIFLTVALIASIFAMTGAAGAESHPVQVNQARGLIISEKLQSPSANNVAEVGGFQAAPPDDESLLRLGVGDSVSVQVYGRPELSTTTYVTEKGAIEVPLAGPVSVAGETPAAASTRIAAALRDGNFLVNPQVTVTIEKFRSQQVSVLGEVRTPSRFPIESRTTIFDLLAQAGGITENGASTIYLLRKSLNGQLARYAINVGAVISGEQSMPTTTLHPGDTVYVPRAKQFYIYGEVQSPNMYRLEPDMTVVQAITRSGGLNARGSNSRIEIIRRDPEGKIQTLHPELNDLVQENDVIRIKERIF